MHKTSRISDPPALGTSKKLVRLQTTPGSMYFLSRTLSSLSLTKAARLPHDPLSTNRYACSLHHASNVHALCPSKLPPPFAGLISTIAALESWRHRTPIAADLLSPEPHEEVGCSSHSRIATAASSAFAAFAFPDSIFNCRPRSARGRTLKSDSASVARGSVMRGSNISTRLSAHNISTFEGVDLRHFWLGPVDVHAYCRSLLRSNADANSFGVSERRTHPVAENKDGAARSSEYRAIGKRERGVSNVSIMEAPFVPAGTLFLEGGLYSVGPPSMGDIISPRTLMLGSSAMKCALLSDSLRPNISRPSPHPLPNVPHTSKRVW
jgi:hypothetical protein